MPEVLMPYASAACDNTLPDTAALPSAPGTRQSPKYTRQQRTHGKKINDKVLFAECYLSGCRKTLSKEKHSEK